MKQIVFTAILIFTFCCAVSAYRENLSFVDTVSIKFDEVFIFDQFGKLPLNEQKARLDSLFIIIKENKDSQSLIEFKLNKDESRKKKIKRFKAISKYFDYRKADKSRFTLVFIEAEEEQTTIWVQPQNLEIEEFYFGEKIELKRIKAEDFEQKIQELFPKK